MISGTTYTIRCSVGLQATVRRYATNVQHARMEQERRADVTRSGLSRDLTAERLRIANAESEERAAKKRLVLMAAKQEREAAMEEAAIQVTLPTLLSLILDTVVNKAPTSVG